MAAPTPFGPEFQVNTTIAGNQDSSSITGLANGKFVVVWEDDSSGTNEVKGQIYNADGSRFGGEKTIAAGSTSQQRPVVTGTADDRLVVAWEDHSGATPNILAHVYNADWTPAGSSAYPAYHDAFLVAPGSPGGFFDKLSQTDPAVGAAAGGRFLVTWSLNNGDDDLYARAYNAAFAFSADAITVRADAGPSENQSAVTGLTNGNYVVAWTGAEHLGSNVHAHIFTGTGASIGADFELDAGTPGDAEFEPAVAGLSDGTFVAVWSRHSAPGHVNLLYRHFQADGTPIVRPGDPIAYNIPLAYNLAATGFQPSVTAGRAGYLVAWVEPATASVSDGSGSHIRAQFFNNNGTAGDEFIANTAFTQGSQSAPAVAALADGRFVISWTDPGQTPGAADISSNSVRAHIFDPRTAAVNLVGTTFGDDWVGTRFNDAMDGATGNDRIDGAAGNDNLFGKEGNDTLLGGLGNDTVTGGGGRDLFVFNTAFKPAANIDTITDFVVIDDTIALENALFTKLHATGVLKDKFFHIGKHAGDHNDYLVYNKTTGVLSYDKDGDGHKHGIAIAQLTDHLPLTSADFLVI